MCRSKSSSTGLLRAGRRSANETSSKLDVALGLDEVDGAGAVDDVGLLVEDLEDALGRGGGPLADHHEEAEHAERRLEHHDVGVERDDRRRR